MSRTKLQKILNRLDSTNDKTLGAIRDFEGGVKSLREKLQQEIQASTLDDVNLKINKLRKSINLEPILLAVQSLEHNFRESVLSILKDIESKSSELEKLKQSTGETKELSEDIIELKNSLNKVIEASKGELERTTKDINVLTEHTKNFASKEDFVALSNVDIEIKKDIKKNEEEIEKTKEDIKKARIELLGRFSERGGGNMNRNIAIGGNVSVLSKYTDINLKAGNNVTITYQRNETTKYTDITLSATGGGGSVGGVVRSINRVSTSQTMGDDAGTDYVYIADQGVLLTLPTAVANTNLYTIKNVSTSSVVVGTTGAETIDTDSNLILPLQFTAVDLVNDGADNWSIT